LFKILPLFHSIIVVILIVVKAKMVDASILVRALSANKPTIGFYELPVYQWSGTLKKKGSEFALAASGSAVPPGLSTQSSLLIYCGLVSYTVVPSIAPDPASALRWVQISCPEEIDEKLLGKTFDVYQLMAKPLIPRQEWPGVQEIRYNESDARLKQSEYRNGYRSQLVSGMLGIYEMIDVCHALIKKINEGEPSEHSLETLETALSGWLHLKELSTPLADWLRDNEIPLAIPHETLKADRIRGAIDIIAAILDLDSSEKKCLYRLPEKTLSNYKTDLEEHLAKNAKEYEELLNPTLAPTTEAEPINEAAEKEKKERKSPGRVSSKKTVESPESYSDSWVADGTRSSNAEPTP
jgi:hypothetical protein